ncbi:MAG: sugar phosphate isomerase/epimerase [Kiritimatiellae bacterium]|nr:sugar phosphate isomerase/epimerase [Kiritimatiellia bacterium]
MDYACNTWGYKGRTLDEAAGKLAQFGYTGIELIAHQPCFHLDVREGPDSWRNSKAVTARHGLQIVALSPATDFLCFDEVKEQKQLEMVDICLKAAETLDVPVLRIFSGGKIPEGRTQEECIEEVARILKKTVPGAERLNKKLAIESHGKFGCDLDAMREILDRIGSPNIGVTLDTSNFQVSGVDPVNAIDVLGDRILHTHLKDKKVVAEGKAQGTVLGQGDAKIAEVVRKLIANGYPGVMTVEIEGFPEEELDRVHEEGLRFLKGL